MDADPPSNRGRPERQRKQPMNALCRSAGVMGTARGEGSMRNSGGPRVTRVAPSTSTWVTVHAGVGEVHSTTKLVKASGGKGPCFWSSSGNQRVCDWREPTTLYWSRRSSEDSMRRRSRPGMPRGTVAQFQFSEIRGIYLCGPWHESSRRAVCGKSARTVRREGTGNGLWLGLRHR